MTRSAKPLFQAKKRKALDDPRQDPLLGDLPVQKAPVRVQDVRDKLDYDPTPRDATRAFLSAEGPRLREIGGPVWENAVGGGHMADVLTEDGFDVIGSDIVDRGWPGTVLRPLEDFDAAPARIAVTNPPYNKINARDGGGFWLTHTLSIGVRYAAFLLNWDWPLAAGLAPVLERHPFSRAYGCRWKIDFRGLGAPPNCNGWFVWDLDGPAPTAQRMILLNRADPKQGVAL